MNYLFTSHFETLKSESVHSTVVPLSHDQLIDLSDVLDLGGIRIEFVIVQSALIHKEVSKVSIVIDGLLTVINLGLRIVDKLGFLRVELDTEERIVGALHCCDEGTSLVIIADCCRSKD